MDVAASIVGLLVAASTVYRTIEIFVSTCANAPDIAQEILAEVRDFKYALNRLRTRISGRGEMTPLGAMATDATQLAVTLASCTLTFSQLERIVDGLTPKRVKEFVSFPPLDISTNGQLQTSEMSVYSRLRWTWENSNLTILIRRIQQHKTTLTLLLTIWMSESSADTEDMVDSLNDILETLTAVTKAIPALATPPVSRAGLDPSLPNIEHLRVPIATSLATGADAFCSDATSTMSVRSRMSFTAILRRSRPYRDPAVLMSSSFSLSTSQRRGTQWSTFSIGSNTSVFSLPFVDFQLSDKPLAEEPDLYKIVIPMKLDLLFSHDGYNHRLPGTELKLSLFRMLLELDDLQLLHDMIPGWTTMDKFIGGYYLRIYVVIGGRENVIKYLLENSTDIDLLQSAGIPDLHVAVLANNEVTLRALLSAGADRTVIWNGETCVERAKRLEMQKMVAILSEGSE